MEMVAGESGSVDLRVCFDRCLKLEFNDSKVTFDTGLLALRELDDALGLTEIAGQVLADSRTGRNNRHALTTQFRQSVFARLAGYDDANRFGHDPAMRWIVGGCAVVKEATSTIPMGRFETEGYKYTICLRANAVLQGHIAPLLDRSVGRPPQHVQRFDARYCGVVQPATPACA